MKVNCAAGFGLVPPASSTGSPPHLYLIGHPSWPVPPDADVRQLGNKAFNLARMHRIGLRVPEALVLGTAYAADPQQAIPDLCRHGLPALETQVGKRLGDPRNPLLVSVRSGAPVSMPGMMDTLLNVGLCDQVVSGLIRQTGNPRLVWDAYRRLVATYGEVVKGIPAQRFEHVLDAKIGAGEEARLDFAELRELTQCFLREYEQACGEPFPQSPQEQLRAAVLAVFASWHGDKARAYRDQHRIDHRLGTAVIVQRMVFGNGGMHSGAGVGFTRNPMTGEPKLWVDFLNNAQGEDVVSGRRRALGADALARWLPDVWQRLQEDAARLENALGDMQDFEFTVEDGALYFLQTRDGKRTPRAAARIALDLLDEQVIDAATARARLRGITEKDLYIQRLACVDSAGAGQTLHPVATAVVASPGIAAGRAVLDPNRALQMAGRGLPVVLVRRDAETTDVAALAVAQGLLTQRGARTSHAAVVARQMNKVCLVGCEALSIDETGQRMCLAGTEIAEGEPITLDGETGCVYQGTWESVAAPDEDLIARFRALLARPRRRCG